MSSFLIFLSRNNTYYFRLVCYLRKIQCSLDIVPLTGSLLVECPLIKVIFPTLPTVLSFSQMSLKRCPPDPTRVTFTLNLKTRQPVTFTKITFTVVRVSLTSLAVMVSCPLLPTHPISLPERVNVTVTDRHSRLSRKSSFRVRSTHTSKESSFLSKLVSTNKETLVPCDLKSSPSPSRPCTSRSS